MKIRQESEAVPIKKILFLGLVSLVISAVLILVAWWMAAAAPARPSLPPPPDEVNQIEMTLLPEVASGLRQHEIQRLHLEQYGWIDKQRRLIHIPIDRAMILYVERQSNRGSR